MRDILFRGKISKNTLGEKGRWIFGYLVDTDMICARYKEPKKNGLTGEQAPVDPETVGQWTGLKDKNGAKIFEGDVLSINTARGSEPHYIKKIVEWNPPYFSGFVFDKQKYESKYHELIGNIHDNPELINPKKGESDE